MSLTIQFSPRLTGEPFAFFMQHDDCAQLRIGPIVIYLEGWRWAVQG